MKLRKKAKYERESYFKMFDLRRESVRVLRILQMAWKRESIKRALYVCDQKNYENQFENERKVRGPLKQGTRSSRHDDGLGNSQIDLNILMKEASNVQKALPFHVPENRRSPFGPARDD